MKRGWILAGFGVATAAGLAIAPFLGTIPTPPGAVLGGEADPRASEVFWMLRLPRVLLAFLAGSTLAVAGMTFQAMFRNPLATPFTLGVSSGAALGAAVCLHLGLGFTLLGISTVSLSAFAGALLSLVLVYGIAVARHGFSAPVMLLTGVAVSFFFSSIILFLQYFSDLTTSFRIVRWLMGGLETVGYEAVLDALPFAVAGSGIILLFTRELNLLSVGDDFAVSHGVETARVRKILFIATTLMVGGVVALCGPIGFVGLMAPHICRLIIGSEHRTLMPATFLFGGLFLVACDTFARLILSPAEIPVGVVTALLGGPFFIWLLLRRAPAGSAADGR